MKAISDWFKRELTLLDPSLHIEYDQTVDRFFILKDLDYVLGKEKHRETFIRASFKYLNDSALTNLRYRQYLGRRYMDRPGAYLRWLKEEEKETMAKVKEEGIDQIVAGLMKAYKLATSQTFS